MDAVACFSVTATPARLPVTGTDPPVANLSMIRKAFIMSVNPGCEAEYEKRHHPIWPELEAALKTHGVSSYSIFLDPATRQLFGCAEVEDEACWQAIAQTDVCRRWWAHMRELMPGNADNSPVAKELKEVFHIEKGREND